MRCGSAGLARHEPFSLYRLYEYRHFLHARCTSQRRCPGTEDQSSGGFDGPYRIEIEVQALRTQEGCPPWQGEGNETPFGRGEKGQQARSGKAAGASGRQEAQSGSQRRRTQEGRTQSRRQESRRQEKSTEIG